MSDYLARLLFEDLPLLLLGEAAALLIVVGLHRRSRTPQSRRRVWMTLAACAGLIAMQKLVVTDREAIRAMVEAMAEVVRKGDVQALGDHFAADMTFEADSGRDAVLRRARSELQRYEIRNPRVSGFVIEIQDGEAKADFHVMADVRVAGGETHYSTPTRWTLKCRHETDGWRVFHAKYELGIAGLRF
ncbi:MAG TPA: nuclear transport factor 2 family protein [Phycisphaerae bacterium]|nr:nuclear transport factor 2 family protein [Phycisphaerae bacterium]